MTRKINLRKEKREKNEEYAKKFELIRRQKDENLVTKKEQRKRLRKEKREQVEKLYEVNYWKGNSWL